MTRRWRRSARGSRWVSAANTAGLPSPAGSGVRATEHGDLVPQDEQLERARRGRRRRGARCRRSLHPPTALPVANRDLQVWCARLNRAAASGAYSTGLSRPGGRGSVRSCSARIASRNPLYAVRYSIHACGCREPGHVMRQHVLVDEAAEPVSSEHAGGRPGTWRDAACGRALIQGSVGSVGVEVLDILPQDDVEVAWSGDQDVVEAFPSQCPDEPFRDRVCSRCLDRGADDPDVGTGEHGVERGGEFAVSVADQEPEPVGAEAEIHEQVAGLLGDPVPGGRPHRAIMLVSSSAVTLRSPGREGRRSRMVTWFSAPTRAYATGAAGRRRHRPPRRSAATAPGGPATSCGQLPRRA